MKSISLLLALVCLFFFPALPLCSTVEQVVILGSGPAGLTAAIYTARAGLSTLVIEGNEPGGQIALSYMVDNFPGFPKGISGYELVHNMQEQAVRFGARVKNGHVVNVDLTKRPFSVQLEEGEIIRTEALIIASGASARWLGIESEKELIGKGVSSCAVCDGIFYKDKDVVVVGGGDAAMEDALFLSKYAQNVIVVHRKAVLRASKYLQDKAFSTPKIRFVWNHVIEDIQVSSQGEVSSVTLRDVYTNAAQQVDCQGVFVAIGHQPNTDLFKDWLELDPSGYIITKPFCSLTNIPGVFAAGDVADPQYRQAITAAGTGCMAGINACQYIQQSELLSSNSRSCMESARTEFEQVYSGHSESKITNITGENYAHIMENNRFVIMDIYADWCGPCKSLATIYHELSEEYGDRYTFTKLNADVEGALSITLKVNALPTILFFKDGEQVHRHIGLISKKKLVDLMIKHFGK